MSSTWRQKRSGYAHSVSFSREDGGESRHNDHYTEKVGHVARRQDIAIAKLLPNSGERYPVIPAKAGIQSGKAIAEFATSVDLDLLDSCFRRNDGRTHTFSHPKF